MTIKTEEIYEALKPVQDPELNRSIVDLGMVKSVSVDNDQVTVEILLTIAGCPLKAKIENDISEALLETNQIDKVQVNFGVMNDEERAKVRELVHGDPASTAGSQPAHGHAEEGSYPLPIHLAKLVSCSSPLAKGELENLQYLQTLRYLSQIAGKA